MLDFCYRLSNIDILGVGESPTAQEESFAQTKTWKEHLADARVTFSSARSVARGVSVKDQRPIFTSASGRLRWFVLSWEARQALLHPNTIIKSRRINCPFTPKQFEPSEEATSTGVGTYNGDYPKMMSWAAATMEKGKETTPNRKKIKVSSTSSALSALSLRKSTKPQ